MRRTDVEEILISTAVNAKINQRHGLSAGDVEDAVARPITARLSTNEHGVERLLIVGVIRSGVRVLVVLFPTDTPGTWRLGTAFPSR